MTQGDESNLLTAAYLVAPLLIYRRQLHRGQHEASEIRLDKLLVDTRALRGGRNTLYILSRCLCSSTLPLRAKRVLFATSFLSVCLSVCKLLRLWFDPCKIFGGLLVSIYLIYFPHRKPYVTLKSYGSCIVGLKVAAFAAYA